MRYMGGKSKIAKRLVTAILSDTPFRRNYFEPFVGGASVLEHAAPHFLRCVGADTHPDLIMMWDSIMNGWDPPELVSREDYYRIKNEPPSALRAYLGFGMSFGGKWWGGYSGDHERLTHGSGLLQGSVLRSMTRQAAILRDHDVVFRHGSFGSLTPPPGTVVYCDPPYRESTGYTTGDFDHPLFYKTLGEWADSGSAVYISEYQPPIGVPYRLIWSLEKGNQLKSGVSTTTSIENLYRIGTPR